MQQGPTVQGAGAVKGGSDPSQPGGMGQPASSTGPTGQDAPGAAGSQANPGQFQAHDAPPNAGGQDNTGYGPGDGSAGHGATSGHHKEPGHDELKYGTHMDTPGREAFEQAPEMAENVSPPSGLASFFQLENDSFWKGILVGSLATLLLTSSTVKKGIMKTAIKASASVKGGIEELKEQLADVEAEVLHELNEKKK